MSAGLLLNNSSGQTETQLSIYATTVQKKHCVGYQRETDHTHGSMKYGIYTRTADVTATQKACLMLGVSAASGQRT